MATKTPAKNSDKERELQVPDWATEIKRKYFSQNISQFILNGNINDFVPIKENGVFQFMGLREFLSEEMFKYKDMVVYYDRAAGLRFKDDTRFGGNSNMRREFTSTLNMLAEHSGMKEVNLDRNPGLSFYHLDKYLDSSLNQNTLKYVINHLKKKLGTGKEASSKSELAIERYLLDSLPDWTGNDSKASEKKKVETQLKKMEAQLKKQKSMAIVIDFAETLIPMGSGNQIREAEQMTLVFLQKWAKEEIFLKADLQIIIITENIASINQQYIRNPYTHEVFIPYPDESSRFDFIDSFMKDNKETKKLFEMNSKVLAKNTAGLGLVHLKTIMSEATANDLPFTNKELMQKKKEMIETEAGGLLEFIKTKFSLKNVAGHKHAKKHLMDASRALKSGRSDVMPMGYLISGPVGTGKTFMITCFANDIGVPMVLLKNFRSQWQGVTEGNLQKVLKILKAMSPVAVMIDEADAYLGKRSASGDSGVSSRVFSMIASFMSDTDNRGKIIWFLVTARPDLMPVDFKRQGRAEEHIGLFYPETLDEKKELLSVMLHKTDLGYLDLEEFDEEFLEDMTVKSGADMEAALTRAKFKAASLGLDKVNPDIVYQVFNDFLPPTYPEEIELMTYSAVLESTSKELLPEKFRNMSRQEVLEKVEDLKSHVR